MSIEQRDKEIVAKYLSELSAEEIGKEYSISSRQVQRIINREGVARTQSESYILAIKRGRMVYHRKPEHLKKKRKTINRALRFKILNKYHFTCQGCGRKPIDGFRIEIDHIDNDPMNNEESNLQVLCSECNQGKSDIENI